MRPSFHRTVVSAFALAVSLCHAGSAHAQPTDATTLSGLWRGTYVCAQGETELELELRGNAHGIVRGTFTFSATAQNRDVPTGAYPLLGRLSGTSLVLRPVDVREMPGIYVPVGIQATVAPGEERIEGWIEGPACSGMTVQRTSFAASHDPLPAGYGHQEWQRIEESEAGVLYADGRPVPGSEASTTRLWARWENAQDIPESPLRAGQALEWELEFDCPAMLVRTWHTIHYAADGQMQDLDASAPYLWRSLAAGSVEEPLYEYACEG